MSPGSAELERRMHADRNAISYRKAHVLDKDANDAWKYPEYALASEEKRRVLMDEYIQRLQDEIYRSKKSAQWHQDQLAIKAAREEQAEEDKLDKTLAHAAGARHLEDDNTEQTPPKVFERLQSVIKDTERKILFGGVASLKAAGYENAEEELEKFQKQVEDPHNIKDASHEYDFDWMRPSEDESSGEEASSTSEESYDKPVFLRRTKEQVTVVYTDDEDDKDEKDDDEGSGPFVVDDE